MVPINYRTPQGEYTYLLDAVISFFRRFFLSMSHCQKEGVLPNTNQDTPYVVLNPNAYGYYRVAYPPPVRQAILTAIRDSVSQTPFLSAAGRIVFLSDLFALCDELQLDARDVCCLFDVDAC